MFYAVLTKNGSLREVCKNIGLIILTLILLGMKQLPAKSTLSDANRKRDHKVFALLYSRLFIHYKGVLQGNWLDIGGEVDRSRVEVFDSNTVGFVFNAIHKRQLPDENFKILSATIRLYGDNAEVESYNFQARPLGEVSVPISVVRRF